MKKYYQTLSTNQKNKIKEIYQKEYANADIKTRLNHLNFYIIASYIFALLLIILGLTNKKELIMDISLALVLIIAGTSFLIGKHIIKTNLLNKIALKNKKN